MTLRLSVVSEHGARLGARATKVFGVHGGTIGRATDNEWILPDPERYLSGKHARIDFRAGAYVLVDTSSNGTYVNGAQVPLGKYHDYVLKDGDSIRIGEYELLVSIDKSNDFPPDESAIVAYDGKAVSSAVRKSTADDLGADLDLNELLEYSDRLDESDPEPVAAVSADSGIRPRGAYGQAIGPEAEPATPWHMMTRPLKLDNSPSASLPALAASSPNLAASSPNLLASSPSLSQAMARAAAPADPDVDAGLAAFCRGAGIDPRSLGENRAVTLQLAGQLLRETVLGLMDLNQVRKEFRNRFRMPPPAADAPDSPLSVAHGVDEALVRLLTTRSQRSGGVETIRDGFRDLKAHQGATVAAMRAAFDEFLTRVDPKELELRFDRATKRGVFGAQNKAKYWELYAEMFVGLAQRPPEGFPHVFSETFAKTFEERLRALNPPKRVGRVADREDGEDPAERAIGER